MTRTNLKRLASTTAFVYLSAMTMVIASERVYWYVGGMSVESILGIGVFYMIPALAVLWTLGSGPSQRLHQIVLGGAVFAFVVEGVLTFVIYEDGPLPIMAALFIGWHGLLSVVGFWYLARRWLIERRRLLLAGSAAATGLYWGVWSIIYRLPEASGEFEESFSVMEPGEFAIYALVVGAALVGAHWLLGWVWPEEYVPTRSGRIGITLIVAAYFAVAVLPAVIWAPVKLAVLLGGALWLLERSRRVTPDEPSVISSLQGRVAFRDAALLTALPVAAIAGYSLVWSMDPDQGTTEALFLTMVATQVVAGLAGFVWAAHRALTQQPVGGTSGVEQPTSSFDVAG